MKIICTFIVEAVDYDTFETFAGFDEFEEKFKANKRGNRTQFYFDNSDPEKINEAKRFLDSFKLAYKQYFSVELESDDELKNYPLVGLVFHTTKFPVVLEKNGKQVIGSKISKRNFHDCTGTGKLVFSEKAKTFFEKKVAHIQFTAVLNEKGTQSWFIVENLKQLNNPRIYPAYTSLEAYKEDTFHIRNTDGRFGYSAASFQEIEQQTCLMENSFIHNGKCYKSPHQSYLCTGAFAYELKKEFDLDHDETTFYIPTLKFV